MEPKNRYEGLNKREEAFSQSPPVLNQGDVVIRRGRRRRRGLKRQERQVRLILMGAAVWFLIVALAATLFPRLRSRHVLPPPAASKLPRTFPVHASGSAVKQVKDARAVWIEQEYRNKEPCDTYKVSGKLVNPGKKVKNIFLEVAMSSSNVPVASTTLHERIKPGEEKPFVLEIEDYSLARDRHSSIQFALSAD